LHPSRKEILKGWLPALVWLAIIAVESTSLFSAENTGRWLYPFFHSIFGVEPARFAVWHHYTRKTGHFVGYFTLSLLLFRAWRATLRFSPESESSGPWSFRWARISLLMTTLVACADEWHQSYIPLRTGTVLDVWLDAAAALVAQIIIFLWLRTRGRQTEKAASHEFSMP
jgi:VanZ family protein